MIGPNKFLVAAAGSGKTTYLVREALKEKNGRVLITTYTDSNETEIRQKFLELNGHVPANVVVMTWFTFLIIHGVKPFQGALFDFPVKGLQLVSTQSGLRATTAQGRPIYWGEEDLEQHYFDRNKRVYSDKLAKLVIRCDTASRGNVFDRITRSFSHIFVDEVQDLAGYDLSVLLALFKSPARVLLAGDPRQVIYLTHQEAKYKKYIGGKLAEFLLNETPKKLAYEIDEDTLNVSHRNNAVICALASELFPEMKASQACSCVTCRERDTASPSLVIVRSAEVQHYLQRFNPVQLRDSIKTSGIDRGFRVMNFGESKGRGFDHVIIFPTKDMVNWTFDRSQELKPTTRAKLYVALTRARHSVAIVLPCGDGKIPAQFTLFVGTDDPKELAFVN